MSNTNSTDSYTKAALLSILHQEARQVQSEISATA